MEKIKLISLALLPLLLLGACATNMGEEHFLDEEALDDLQRRPVKVELGQSTEIEWDADEASMVHGLKVRVFEDDRNRTAGRLNDGSVTEVSYPGILANDENWDQLKIEVKNVSAHRKYGFWLEAFDADAGEYKGITSRPPGEHGLWAWHRVDMIEQEGDSLRVIGATVRYVDNAPSHQIPEGYKHYTNVEKRMDLPNLDSTAVSKFRIIPLALWQKKDLFTNHTVPIVFDRSPDPEVPF
jgi:hypothetical protein